MTQKQALQIFDEKKIRTAWDDNAEKWYFSVVDVVAALTDSPNPQTYWRVLKKRLKDEGNQRGCVKKRGTPSFFVPQYKEVEDVFTLTSYRGNVF